MVTTCMSCFVLKERENLGKRLHPIIPFPTHLMLPHSSSVNTKKNTLTFSHIKSCVSVSNLHAATNIVQIPASPTTDVVITTVQQIQLRSNPPAKHSTKAFKTFQNSKSFQQLDSMKQKVVEILKNFRRLFCLITSG